MSTISSTSAHHLSPKQRILDSIASQAQTGAITSTDQTALDSAVESIDDSLTSGSSSGTGTTSRTRLDPSEMKSRVDSLISAQVESGSLTSAQADTLKQIFAQGPGGAGRGGGEGPGGIGGAGGPPPGPPLGPPPSDDASGDTGTSSGGTTASTTSTDGTTTTTGSNDVGALLASFIKQLQDVQGRLSGYSAGGQSGGSRTASAMLVNFEA